MSGIETLRDTFLSFPAVWAKNEAPIFMDMPFLCELPFKEKLTAFNMI